MDREIVEQIYRDGFHARFATTRMISFIGVGWGDAEVARFASMIGPTHTPNLSLLDLSGNRFGATGCTALANALTRTTPMGSISLSSSGIGDEGAKCLAHVIVRTHSRCDLA